MQTRGVPLGQLYNYCLPERLGHSVGKGEVILHDYNVAMVYWLERTFENAFSLYTILKIMLKQLINCS